VLSPAHALSLIATGEGIINFFMFFPFLIILNNC